MKDKPCFVQLESVEHESEYENIPLRLLAISLALICLLLTNIKWLAIPALICFAIVLILAMEMASKYKTSLDALCIEGRTLFGYSWCKIIKWTDVKDASLTNLGIGRILLTLNNGKHRSVILGRVKGKFPDDCNSKIEASIYQHLNKAGKAGNLQLRPDTESYFTEIPDWVPDTMPVEREEDDIITTYSVDPTLLEVKWIPSGEDPSYIDKAPKDIIEFSKVQYCEWNPYAGDGFEFELSTGTADTAILVKTNEPEMQKLILAIIRQLRKNPATDAIWLPNVLTDYIKEGK